MTKAMLFILLFLFLNGLFITPITSVSAAGLVEDSWTTKTSMSQPRWEMGVVAVDSKIYAIGGCANDFVGTNECYDPKTNTWTTLEPMPTPRGNFVIFAHQNKIYCIGGIIRERYLSGYMSVPVNATEIYDIATDSWSTKPASFDVTGLANTNTNVINEQNFIVNDNQLLKYDITTDISTTKIITVGTPYFTSAVAVDDKIIFISQQSKDGMENLTVQIYDPKTDKLTEGTSNPTEAWGIVVGSTTGNYAPKKVYVLGEHVDITPMSAEGGVLVQEQIIESWPVNHVYDPDSDTWSTAKAPSVLVDDRYYVVNVDDILYLIGGTINEQYVPIGYHGITSVPETAKSNPSEPFLIYSIIVAAILTVSIVVVGLCYFQKKIRK